MRSMVILLLVPVLFFVSAQAGDQVDSLYDFMRSVRMEVGVSECSQLPDTVLIDLSQRAINYTSNDIGGVESMVRITTAEWQSMYALPDSVVRVLYSCLIMGKTTLPLIKWPPQALYKVTIEELEEEFGGDNYDLTPLAFNIWDDSIQFMPIPVRDDDTAYLKCYVEHPLVDADSSDVLLTGDFLEAAIQYTCHLVYRRLRLYNEAAAYSGLYEATGKKIKNRVVEQSIEVFEVAK